ncbi:hypothetical protein LWC35_34450 [Pseudonocardia kujensis]|uniref:hypothetical protein n=1 Tax=Pseudonocardia kujensis TaxID=1128675 RepID=UPI001E548B9B|nr:hypothetical protein [Pseudonocardia kujensis]MCE0767963.1 hypothetical protein [Pseudonocardia kujensis]
MADERGGRRSPEHDREPGAPVRDRAAGGTDRTVEAHRPGADEDTERGPVERPDGESAEQERPTGRVDPDSEHGTHSPSGPGVRGDRPPFSGG